MFPAVALNTAHLRGYRSFLGGYDVFLLLPQHPTATPAAYPNWGCAGSLLED